MGHIGPRSNLVQNHYLPEQIKESKESGWTPISKARGTSIVVAINILIVVMLFEIRTIMVMSINKNTKSFIHICNMNDINNISVT